MRLIGQGRACGFAPEDVARGFLAVRQADLWAGSLVLAVALLLVLGAFQLPQVEGLVLGPGSLPLGLGIALGLLSLALIASSLAGRSDDGPVAWPRGRELRRIALAVASLVLYTAVVPVLGYFLATLLFLAALIRVVGSLRWRAVVPASLALTLLLYLVFRVWLQISLPAGFVGG